jgi:hypothetical protein
LVSGPKREDGRNCIMKLTASAPRQILLSQCPNEEEYEGQDMTMGNGHIILVVKCKWGDLGVAGRVKQKQILRKAGVRVQNRLKWLRI